MVKPRVHLAGDGVNVAARIEALADAGGVFVSGTVFDQVRDRLSFGFEDLGEQQVKNIARPVRVLLVEDVTRRWIVLLAVLLVWTAAAFGVGWWFGGAGQGTVQLHAGAVVFDAQGHAYIPVERR